MEALFCNELRNWSELSDIVVEVRDYRMREDGTPGYVMVNKMEPLKTSHRSDDEVYEPSHRSVDRTPDSMLEGRFVVEHDSIDGGTKVSHRFEVEPSRTSRANADHIAFRRLLHRSPVVVVTA